MENSFLAFILEMQKSIKNDDLLFWEKILSLRELPVFNDIKDETLLSNIQDIYNIKTFKNIIQKNVLKFLFQHLNILLNLGMASKIRCTNKKN